MKGTFSFLLFRVLDNNVLCVSILCIPKDNPFLLLSGLHKRIWRGGARREEREMHLWRCSDSLIFMRRGTTVVCGIKVRNWWRRCSSSPPDTLHSSLFFSSLLSRSLSIYFCGLHCVCVKVLMCGCALEVGSLGGRPEQISFLSELTSTSTPGDAHISANYPSS